MKVDDGNLMNPKSKDLVQKWLRTGLLEELDEKKKHKMARLLENQAQYILKCTEEDIGENFESKEWTAIIFPLVRRVFAEIDFDVVALPSYINKNGEPKVVQTYNTKSSFPVLERDLTCGHLDAEVELVKKLTSELVSFFKENTSNGERLVVYTPFLIHTVRSADDNNLRHPIAFRGRFEK